MLVFSARAPARPLGELSDGVAVSVVTIGELQLGNFHASDGTTHARRADTLALARVADPIPIGEAIKVTWARLVSASTAAGGHRTIKVTDALSAATAIEHGLPVVTQDADYDQMLVRTPTARS